MKEKEGKEANGEARKSESKMNDLKKIGRKNK